MLSFVNTCIQSRFTLGTSCVTFLNGARTDKNWELEIQCKYPFGLHFSTVSLASLIPPTQNLRLVKEMLQRDPKFLVKPNFCAHRILIRRGSHVTAGHILAVYRFPDQAIGFTRRQN